MNSNLTTDDVNDAEIQDLVNTSWTSAINNLSQTGQYIQSVHLNLRQVYIISHYLNRFHQLCQTHKWQLHPQNTQIMIDLQYYQHESEIIEAFNQYRDQYIEAFTQLLNQFDKHIDCTYGSLITYVIVESESLSHKIMGHCYQLYYLLKKRYPRIYYHNQVRLTKRPNDLKYQIIYICVQPVEGGWGLEPERRVIKKIDPDLYVSQYAPEYTHQMCTLM